MTIRTEHMIFFQSQVRWMSAMLGPHSDLKTSQNISKPWLGAMALLETMPFRHLMVPIALWNSEISCRWSPIPQVPIYTVSPAGFAIYADLDGTLTGYTGGEKT